MPATLCAHARPDHHQPGETCRYAADLKPGDSVAVLPGIFMTVYDARPADDLTVMDIVYDHMDADDPALTTQVPARALVSVIPADGLTTEEKQHQDQAPAIMKPVNLPDCAYSWTYEDKPCYDRPAFVITGFDKAERLACLKHAGAVLAEITGPAQAASVIEFEGE
ncbi:MULTISPECIES: hypothetical protein [unclassified Streptomyces]|uniref:hypothetical protein n=1 Tax=unclassified Streptomyces TaxID=2593676 RepID=UPI000DBA34A2|nr:MULTISPECIES: hypothetical protein [unclassified Streptomyces]MYT72473.1 hypothetical protein [Streptomyces sp. SID8367]RAJ70619.1 hypothetical protein K377_07901 [Streptomyces sp. PsTaAH-137]